MKSNQIKQAFESIQADSDLADRVIDAAAGASRSIERATRSLSMLP